ncbi:MAG: CBS domain-containing protein [Halanaerobiales bacterium]
MDIIVSHQPVDLDGLGAMVAANKLYPDAKPVLSGRLHRTVKDFLVLYKDEIETYTLEDIDFNELNRIIMVDTYKKEMLGDINGRINWDDCEVIIYDHHPHQKKDWVSLDLSEEVGSATTILVNRIVAEDLKLNPFEATVCALAIYADTGNLTYLNSTAHDARALAYLLDAGANLQLINDFIKEPLNNIQQELLEKLIEYREDINIDGILVSLFSIEYDQYVAGINRIAEQIKILYTLDNLFIVFLNGEKAEVIGRSSDEAVDIGKICSTMGGGGHSGAGAARVDGDDLDQIKRRLIKVIEDNVQPLLRVRKIMSSPVRTISPETTIDEVEEMMKKFGHNGFVVVDDEKIRGIFSRRDLYKVKGHNLMHAPVKAYMTREVISIDADDSVSKAQELMVEHGVGRLPVIEGEKLVGIITRSNVLASYYGKDTPYQNKHRYGSSMVDIFKSESDVSEKLDNLSEDILGILKNAGKTAAKNGVNAYLIGGMVRDMLLDTDNKDLDIVIDGSLESYISELAEALNGEYTFNNQFRTGGIQTVDGFHIDLAETRREVYQYTGALPEVESSNMIEDLFRRDYTINALSICLNPDKWGTLLDYFAGVEDLEKRLLRSLHRFSFLDDPTRIIRGIRLAARLDFSFEEETSDMIRETIKTADFSRLTNERVIKELELLFQNPITETLYNLLKKYNIFKLLNIDIEIKEEYLQQARKLEAFLAELVKKNYNIEEWILRMAVFTDQLKTNDIWKWNIKGKYKDIILTYSKNSHLISELDTKLDPVSSVELMSDFSNEQLIILMIKSESSLLKENIIEYLEHLRNIEININGHDLLEMGMEAGPAIREILDMVYRARLREEITTRKDQLDYARKLIEEM